MSSTRKDIQDTIKLLWEDIGAATDGFSSRMICQAQLSVMGWDKLLSPTSLSGISWMQAT